jgi:hypothetical protein
MVNKISKKHYRKPIIKYRDKHKLITRNKLGKQKSRRQTRKKYKVLSGGGIIGDTLLGSLFIIIWPISLITCLSLWLCFLVILIIAACSGTLCLGLLLPSFGEILYDRALFNILEAHGLMYNSYSPSPGYYIVGGGKSTIETIIPILLNKLGQLGKQLNPRLCKNLLKISLVNVIKEEKKSLVANLLYDLIQNPGDKNKLDMCSRALATHQTGNKISPNLLNKIKKTLLTIYKNPEDNSDQKKSKLLSSLKYFLRLNTKPTPQKKQTSQKKSKAAQLIKSSISYIIGKMMIKRMPIININKDVVNRFDEALSRTLPRLSKLEKDEQDKEEEAREEEDEAREEEEEAREEEEDAREEEEDAREEEEDVRKEDKEALEQESSSVFTRSTTRSPRLSDTQSSTIAMIESSSRPVDEETKSYKYDVIP